MVIFINFSSLRVIFLLSYSALTILFVIVFVTTVLTFVYPGIITAVFDSAFRIVSAGFIFIGGAIFFFVTFGIFLTLNFNKLDLKKYLQFKVCLMMFNSLV